MNRTKSLMAAQPDTVPEQLDGKAPPLAEPGGALLAMDHEELVIRRGRRTGVYTIVAVHSTLRGPALGGCRMWPYPNSTEGARDALRLSRAMTLKAAAADLALGGGKGVICLPPGARAPEGELRREILRDFGDAVESLVGSYICAEDVGTSARDMVSVAERTRFVTGLPRVHGGSGDPSPFTALGIRAAMRSCCAERFGDPGLAGRRVTIVGCGRVGGELARLLSAAGARLLLSDIDARKRALAAELPNAGWVEPADALTAEADVLAPCALGGVLDEHTVDALRCQVVCGSANNQLAHDALAERLAARGILYAPDFIVNAGGLMNVALELDQAGYDPAVARRRVLGIERALGDLLARARESGITPLAAAGQLARSRLAAAGAGTIDGGDARTVTQAG
jgi:leucine dehydrogenase